jgi:hypothetical protein
MSACSARNPTATTASSASTRYHRAPLPPNSQSKYRRQAVRTALTPPSTTSIYHHAAPFGAIRTISPTTSCIPLSHHSAQFGS